MRASTAVCRTAPRSVLLETANERVQTAPALRALSAPHLSAGSPAVRREPGRALDAAIAAVHQACFAAPSAGFASRPPASVVALAACTFITSSSEAWLK